MTTATTGNPGDAGDAGLPADVVDAHLRELAAGFDQRDRTMGRLVRWLLSVQHDEVLHDRLGGMTLEIWLEHEARLPKPDARSLVGAIDVLRHLPSLVAGLCDRWVSWRQVQQICAAAKKVPVKRLAELDALLASAIVDMADVEPGALVADVWRWVDAIQPTRLERDEKRASESEFISMQPNLFGGGSMYGQYGTEGWATITEALDAALPTPDVTPDDVDGMSDDQIDDMYDTLDERRRARTRSAGAARAAKLRQICEQHLGGNTGDGDSGSAGGSDDDRGRDGGAGAPGRSGAGSPGGGAGGGAGNRPRPLLLATININDLLNPDRTEGWLLHTLAGGRMKVSSQLLQHLIDKRGADLEGIVLDDCGQIVGVGHRTPIPPGWLRRAIWARDVTVTDPDGATPIRRADLDHILPWNPQDPTAGGPADVANLQPLSRRWHNLKTSKQWDVTRRADGTTIWTHRQHGWTIRLAPTRREPLKPARDRPPGTLPDSRASPEGATAGGIPRAGPSPPDRQLDLDLSGD